ncbi:hypothetical protein MHI18_03605 [Peribacillus sp. FSL H8-0477]|uniref:hypothetical protein n=1 Tax=Peribacillus sp. FSL H8-0477 TaxID=2921388 RepID=UPI0030FA6381
MESREIENVFEAAGYDFLYRNFHYQVYVSGLFEKIDNPALLEKFLECYGFEPEQSLIFDEFAFHFRIFENLYHKNNLKHDPDFYWH